MKAIAQRTWTGNPLIFPTSTGYIQCESISNNVIDLLLVDTNKNPLIKNRTPNEATSEDNLP